MARKQAGDWTAPDDGDENLPWLEPASGHDDRGGPSRGRLLIWVAVIVALLFLIVASFGWLKGREEMPEGDQAGLIKAPATPYKVRPDDPGGMVVEGQGDTIYAAGAGVDPGGTIDLSALPEEPIARSAPGVEADDVAITQLPPSNAGNGQGAKPQPAQPAPPAKPAPPAAPAPHATTSNAVAPKAEPAKPAPHKAEERKAQEKTVPAKPAADAASAGTGNGSFGLQLGAFSSRAKAEAAWKTLSGRFIFLGALNKSVQPLTRDGATLYRLRATGVADRKAAENLCGRMKVSGDGCTVVAP